MSVFTRHWELKLLAVGFSLALWLFVANSEKTDLILSAPIEFDGVPPGLVLTSERPDTVDIQIHGLRGALTRLTPDQIKARVSLHGTGPGEVTVRVLPEQVIVPVGVTVVRVNPSRIRVMLSEVPPPRSEAGRPAPRS
jgi:YbbR-like protein